MITGLLNKGINFSFEFITLVKETNDGHKLGILLTFKKGNKTIESFDTIPNVEFATKDLESFLSRNFGAVFESLEESFNNYDEIFTTDEVCEENTTVNQNFTD